MKGYLQRQRVEYDKIFLPWLCTMTMRFGKWMYKGLSPKNLEEEVYMIKFEGYIIKEI